MPTSRNKLYIKIRTTIEENQKWMKKKGKPNKCLLAQNRILSF
jgi:hypothetical protein